MALGEYIGAGTGTTKGLYHLNGNANDDSGNGNNGTASNVTWVDGKVGSGAASFNGSSSVITTANKIGISGNGNRTISAWIKVGTVVNGDMGIVERGQESNGKLFRPQIAYVSSSTYKLKFSGWFADLTGDTTFNNGIWQQVTFVYNGTTLYIYENGKLEKSGNLTLNTTYSTIKIGKSGSSGYFPGLIDEVIIENRVWTPEEIKKYYTYTKGRFGIL